METRVFSPSAYTFGEQRPRPCHEPHDHETTRGKKRKVDDNPFLKARNGSEKTVKSKIGNESANGSNFLAQPPGHKKRTKRTSLNHS